MTETHKIRDDEDSVTARATTTAGQPAGGKRPKVSLSSTSLRSAATSSTQVVRRTDAQRREHRTSFSAASMSGGALVVEHDPELQSKLARELTLLGYQVVGASTGDGALALMSQWPVDVVVVDEDLPGGGINLASRIADNFDSIPVVLLSEHDDLEGQVVDRHGIIACLRKASAPGVFRSRIEECLASRQAAIGAAE